MGRIDLEYLAVELPEDLARLKATGEFSRLNRLIDDRLARVRDTALARRLQLEREILARLPENYPLTRAAALTALQARIKDFTASELDALSDSGAAEWIYIDGAPRYHRYMPDNLLKTRPEFEARALNPEARSDREANARLLDQTIAQMKAQGGMAVQIRVRASIRLRPEFLRPGGTLFVHLPIPVETAQAQNFRLIAASPEPKFVSAPNAPQRTVYFEAPATDAPFWVEYEFENHMRYVSPDPQKVLPLPDRAQLQAALCEEAPHIVFTPHLKALAREIAGTESNPLVQARRIYDYLTREMCYSFVRSYLTIDNLPEYMATSRKGDCGIFALLFITLARILGIPAQWQSGLFTTPKFAGCHDWARFYIEPYGWLYADASFGTSARIWGSQARHEFYFGNLDPYRMPAAQAFQMEFDPPKAFLREDPYDNQVGEMEYADAPLFHRHTINAQDILSVREIPCQA